MHNRSSTKKKPSPAPRARAPRETPTKRPCISPPLLSSTISSARLLPRRPGSEGSVGRRLSRREHHPARPVRRRGRVRVPTPVRRPPRVHPPIVVRAPLIHLRRLGRLRELQPTVSRAVRVRVRLETPAGCSSDTTPTRYTVSWQTVPRREAPARGLDIATRTPSPIPRGGRCPNEPRGRRTTRGVRTTPRARRARRGGVELSVRSRRLQTFRVDARVPVHRGVAALASARGERCTRGRVETTKHSVPGNVPASARGTVVRVPWEVPTKNVPVPSPSPSPSPSRSPSPRAPRPRPRGGGIRWSRDTSGPYPARWGRRPAGVRAGVSANTVLCDRRTPRRRSAPTRRNGGWRDTTRSIAPGRRRGWTGPRPTRREPPRRRAPGGPRLDRTSSRRREGISAKAGVEAEESASPRRATSAPIDETTGDARARRRRRVRRRTRA